MEEKFHCGFQGYLMHTAYKQCEAFRTEYHSFPHSARQWVRDANVCMKKQMLRFYLTEDLTCSELEKEGKQNVVQCYVDTGFCSLMTDWRRPTEIL